VIVIQKMPSPCHMRVIASSLASLVSLTAKQQVVVLQCAWCRHTRNYHKLMTCAEVFSARQHIAHMLSPVRPSVTRFDQPKMVEVKIMKFSPYGIPIPKVSVG